MRLFSNRDTPQGMRNHAAHLRRTARATDGFYSKGAGDQYRRSAEQWEDKAREAERRGR